jgi:hypothetical protein
MVVYHLELRAFPHVSRAFNLDRETLDTRFLKPWVAGELIDHDDRRWAPDRTRLTVLEGPELAVEQRGLGRGWGEASRHGRDVTDAVLAEVHRGAEARPEVEALKDALGEVVGGGRELSFPDVIDLAAVGHPGWRASEQLSLAEQAVWEMLHQSRLAMRRDLEEVPPASWQEIVLDWATWADSGDGPAPRLGAPKR